MFAKPNQISAKMREEKQMGVFMFSKVNNKLNLALLAIGAGLALVALSSHEAKAQRIYRHAPFVYYEHFEMKPPTGLVTPEEQWFCAQAVPPEVYVEGITTYSQCDMTLARQSSSHAGSYVGWVGEITIKNPSPVVQTVTLRITPATFGSSPLVRMGLFPSGQPPISGQFLDGRIEIGFPLCATDNNALTAIGGVAQSVTSSGYVPGSQESAFVTVMLQPNQTAICFGNISLTLSAPSAVHRVSGVFGGQVSIEIQENLGAIEAKIREGVYKSDRLPLVTPAYSRFDLRESQVNANRAI